MKPRPGRKGLAVTTGLVVIVAFRKPTGTRSTGRSRYVRRKAAARLKRCKGSLFCIAKAVRIPDPTAPNGRSADSAAAVGCGWVGYSDGFRDAKKRPLASLQPCRCLATDVPAPAG